ncbi:hypothetical protein NQ661_16240, partial [Acinetobacter baumannii]|nr:hypothetical protein [Acinetobacter baumannii]
MLIDNIIERIDEGGPRSYYSFETFILHLLKYHIERQNKKFIINLGPTSAGDGLAPAGFDDFLGPTLIEIKFNLAKQSIPLVVDKLYYHISSRAEKVGLTDLIIISAK